MPAFSTSRRRLRLAIRLQGGGCNRTVWFSLSYNSTEAPRIIFTLPFIVWRKFLRQDFHRRVLETIACLCTGQRSLDDD
jgi:hypothetical protein